MKKIAIPTNENAVDSHFGHCQYYTIFTLANDDSIESRELLPSPAGCGCKSEIAGILANMGVTTMLAGNMGEGALIKLNGAGLDVHRGFSGDVDSALNAYLSGFKGDERMCEAHKNHNHGGDGHTCNH
jgi:predicted Fe-Mo cluster-binding NifX family protein